jgi:hypothetical protein
MGVLGAVVEGCHDRRPKSNCRPNFEGNLRPAMRQSYGVLRQTLRYLGGIFLCADLRRRPSFRPVLSVVLR